VPEEIRFDPDAFYHDGQLRLLLGITTATLIAARREGRLLFTRKGKRLLYRGQWVIDWLNQAQRRQEVRDVS
jgi:hypothetical protein